MKTIIKTFNRLYIIICSVPLPSLSSAFNSFNAESIHFCWTCLTSLVPLKPRRGKCMALFILKPACKEGNKHLPCSLCSWRSWIVRHVINEPPPSWPSWCGVRQKQLGGVVFPLHVNKPVYRLENATQVEKCSCFRKARYHTTFFGSEFSHGGKKAVFGSLLSTILQ